MSIQDDDKVEEAVLKWLSDGNVPKEALNVEDDDDEDDDGEPDPVPDFIVDGQGYYVGSITVAVRKVGTAETRVADPSGSAAEDDDD